MSTQKKTSEDLLLEEEVVKHNEIVLYNEKLKNNLVPKT